MNWTTILREAGVPDSPEREAAAQATRQRAARRKAASAAGIRGFKPSQTAKAKKNTR